MLKTLLNPIGTPFKNACELLGGYSKPCSNGRGGVKAVTFLQKEHVSSYTLDGDNQVTAITLTSGNRGWKYALEMNLSNYTDVMTRSRENGTLFALQTLTIILNDNRQATRNNLVLLAQNDLLAVVELANGNYELLGADNGLALTTDTRESGTLKADRSGHTIEMVGEENELAYLIDSTIVAGLLIPAS
jgi:hypothetical protein